MRWHVVLVAALLAALLAGCGEGVGGGRPIDGPVVAVVSYAPTEVVLIDPGTLSVLARVPLRSMGVSPVGLPGRRAFVIAQCGGVGTDSDDALAMIDLGSGGRVEYIELPTPNPCGVAAVSDDDLVVIHGVWDTSGLAATLVDLGDGGGRGGCSVPNVAGSSAVAGGWLWTAGPEGSDEASMTTTVRRTACDLGTSEVAAECSSDAVLVVADAAEPETMLTVESADGCAHVARRSTRDFELLAEVAVPGIREAVSAAVVVGESLVLCDGTGADTSNPGGPLIVLDRESLGEVRRIDVGGRVSSMAAVGDVLYTVSWQTGEIVAVDVAAGRVVRRGLIPGCEEKVLQVAAIG